MAELAAGVTPGVMPGVTLQVIGKHSGNAVAFPRSIDRRDYSRTPCEEPHNFDCYKLVHFTENKYADAIGRIDDVNAPFCFKANPWRTSSFTSMNLSWWSPKPHSSWQEQVDFTLPNIWSEFEDIANSSALNGRSFCGPVGFQIKWKDILRQYALSRQQSIDDVELRILGTFLYKSEIMYAVLVCVRGDFNNEIYPIIGATGTEAFKPGPNNEYFTWNVYSTVGFSKKRNPNVEWTWDHISFGFHCPTSDLIIEPKFCRIIEKNATEHMPSSRSERYETTTHCMVASEQLMSRLRHKTERSAQQSVAFRNLFRH